MAGRYVTTKHHKTKKAHTFQIRTYVFRCSNCKNTGTWSDLAAIIQIHSICKEVFPLMPAWKLPSSWQPEAEENGRESASPKVNMAMESHSLIISDGNANTLLVICQSEQANGVLDCEMLQKDLCVYATQTYGSYCEEFQQITTSCVLALGLLSLTKDGDIRARITLIFQQCKWCWWHVVIKQLKYGHTRTLIT